MSFLFCQLPCDTPLLLSTSPQLADIKQREGRRPRPNLGTLNIPLDPCQDSQAAAFSFTSPIPHFTPGLSYPWRAPQPHASSTGTQVGPEETLTLSLATHSLTTFLNHFIKKSNARHMRFVQPFTFLYKSSGHKLILCFYT